MGMNIAGRVSSDLISKVLVLVKRTKNQEKKNTLKEIKTKYPDCYYDADMDAIYWNGQTVAEDAKYLIEDHYEGNKTWHTDKFGNPEDNTYGPCSGEDYIIAELNHDYHYAFENI